MVTKDSSSNAVDQTTPKTSKVFTTFRIVTQSTNLNSFGLRNHIMITKTGEAFEAARSDCSGSDRLITGMDVKVPTVIQLDDDGNYIRADYNWAAINFELPRKLQSAPPAVVNEVFSKPAVTV